MCIRDSDGDIWLFGGSTRFLFTIWFGLVAIGLVAGSAIDLDYSEQTWPVRVSINVSVIAACLALTLATRRLFSIP